MTHYSLSLQSERMHSPLFTPRAGYGHLSTTNYSCLHHSLSDLSLLRVDFGVKSSRHTRLVTFADSVETMNLNWKFKIARFEEHDFTKLTPIRRRGLDWACTGSSSIFRWRLLWARSPLCHSDNHFFCRCCFKKSTLPFAKSVPKLALPLSRSTDLWHVYKNSTIVFCRVVQECRISGSTKGNTKSFSFIDDFSAVVGFGNDSVMLITWEKTRRDQLGVSTLSFIKAVAQWKLPATGNWQRVITEVVEGRFSLGSGQRPHNLFYNILTKFTEYEIGSDNAGNISQSLILSSSSSDWTNGLWTLHCTHSQEWSICRFNILSAVTVKASINWLATTKNLPIFSCCSGWEPAAKEDGKQNLQRKSNVQSTFANGKREGPKIRPSISPRTGLWGVITKRIPNGG